MSRGLGIAGISLVLAGTLLIGASAVVGGASTGLGQVGTTLPAVVWAGPGMMGGRVGSSGVAGAGPFIAMPGPGQPGFIAGSSAQPRVIRVIAGPGYSFTPRAIAVVRGETVTFVVTSMGGLVHEFMVGPAADVAADKGGTPEVANLGMMQTGVLTYTFDGDGPYAFACHAPGHYEAGMQGTISIVG